MCHPVEVYMPLMLARLIAPERVQDTVVLTAEEKQTVTYTDALEYTLDLPDLVANKKETVRAILEKHGWMEKDGAYVKEFGGARAVCNLETGKIRLSVKEQDLVGVAREITKELGITVPMFLASLGEKYLKWRSEREQQKIEQKVKEETAKKVEEAERKLREKVEATLQSADEALRKELTEVSVEYYAESVKEKAREMGEITQLEEGWTQNREEFSMTIELKEYP